MSTNSLALAKVVGSGYFGDVWEGLDPIHGKVAVKRLRRQRGETEPSWKARSNEIYAEGRSLVRATGPNIVQVFYVTTLEDQPALVMEFCENGSMQARYEAGPLGLGAVRGVADQVLLGLQCLHQREMIHRDIKPGNILEGLTSIKLGDFGLVTDRIVLGYASQRGYADHLPPEVHHGSGTSIKSDVWALGMTLYRLLHGHEWYRRSQRPRVTVGGGGFAKRLDWLPHVTDDWRRMIRKAMHDDPRQRIANAHEFMNQVSRLRRIEFDWRCTVGHDSVEWTRTRGARQDRVEWHRTPRSSHWQAVTVSGDGKPRVYRKGSSRSALEELFASWR